MMVEDNLSYYGRIVEVFNRNILYPLSTYGLTTYIKSDTLLQYASLYKILFGSLHEPHSYLAENSIKAMGIRLFINEKFEKTKSLIEDFSK